MRDRRLDLSGPAIAFASPEKTKQGEITSMTAAATQRIPDFAFPERFSQHEEELSVPQSERLGAVVFGGESDPLSEAGDQKWPF